jgi:Zn finger protein HypA/HybF involved in hydrogenase expression
MKDTPNKRVDEFEANREEIECQTCGQLFNLGAQPYYAPCCPKCRDDPERGSEEDNLEVVDGDRIGRRRADY